MRVAVAQVARVIGLPPTSTAAEVESELSHRAYMERHNPQVVASLGQAAPGLKPTEYQRRGIGVVGSDPMTTPAPAYRRIGVQRVAQVAPAAGQGSKAIRHLPGTGSAPSSKGRPFFQRA